MFYKANHSYSVIIHRHKYFLAILFAMVCLLFLISPSKVLGQAKVGTTGAQFLELGVSARAMGMAEAFTAVSDDISSVYYNPDDRSTWTVRPDITKPDYYLKLIRKEVIYPYSIHNLPNPQKDLKKLNPALWQVLYRD